MAISKQIISEPRCTHFLQRPKSTHFLRWFFMVFSDILRPRNFSTEPENMIFNSLWWFLPPTVASKGLGWDARSPKKVNSHPGGDCFWEGEHPSICTHTLLRCYPFFLHSRGECLWEVWPMASSIASAQWPLWSKLDPQKTQKRLEMDRWKGVFNLMTFGIGSFIGFAWRFRCWFELRFVCCPSCVLCCCHRFGIWFWFSLNTCCVNE